MIEPEIRLRDQAGSSVARLMIWVNWTRIEGTASRIIKSIGRLIIKITNVAGCSGLPKTQAYRRNRQVFETKSGGDRLLRENGEIRDVLITGGDLLASDELIRWMLKGSDDTHGR